MHKTLLYFTIFYYEHIVFLKKNLKDNFSIQIFFTQLHLFWVKLNNN